MLRYRYQKRKVIGGKIGGNVFDIVKNLVMAGSKLVVSHLPELAKTMAMGAANMAGQKLGQKLLPKVGQGTKQLLSDNSRGILSNLIEVKKKCGGGMKRII
jgi:hypothetical protein